MTIPVELDIIIDVSDRLYALLKRDSELLKETVKDFKSTIKELIDKFDTNFEKLAKQLENIKK